jgi:hypothetical protein
MAEHEQLAQRLAIQIFFADPYSPWQRGTSYDRLLCMEGMREMAYSDGRQRSSILWHRM